MPSKKREKSGLNLVKVKTKDEGLSLAKKILYKLIDQKTVLFLSGGTTPGPLYKSLSKEKNLKVGAVALVDERYGEPFHKESNERMIKDTGFLSCLEDVNVRFYAALKKGKDLAKTAKDYDKTVRYLLFSFPKSVGIFGIGSDGHTAGIAPNRKNFQKDLFVSYFDDGKDFKSGFGKRITLTFKAMQLIDVLMVLAFGESKKIALEKMFSEGSLEETPARFFKKEKIAEKTLLITDQKV